MASKSAKKKSSKKKPAANANVNSSPAPAKKKSAVALAEAKAEKIVKASEASDKQKGGKKQNPVARYFKELRSEFKKVVWPSRKTVVNNTSVVLIAMVLSSIVIWGLDSAFAALLKLIIK